MLVLRPDYAGRPSLKDAGFFRRDPGQVLA
jgi:hypothetical protein